MMNDQTPNLVDAGVGADDIDETTDPNQRIMMVQYALDDRWQSRDEELRDLMDNHPNVSGEGSGAGFGMRDHEYWLHDMTDAEAEELLKTVTENLELDGMCEAGTDDYAFLTTYGELQGEPEDEDELDPNEPQCESDNPIRED